MVRSFGAWVHDGLSGTAGATSTQPLNHCQYILYNKVSPQTSLHEAVAEAGSVCYAHRAGLAGECDIDRLRS